MSTLTKPQRQVLEALYAGGHLRLYTNQIHTWAVDEHHTALFPVAVNTFRALFRRQYIQRSADGYTISDAGCVALDYIPLSEANAGLSVPARASGTEASE